jgi:acyl-CoA thioesterase I
VIRRIAAEEDLSFLDLHDRLMMYLKEHEKDRAGLPPRLAYRDGLINIGNALALHAQGLSWNEVSRRNGLLLTTDCLHLNDTGGAMIADLIEDWLRKAPDYRAET